MSDEGVKYAEVKNYFRWGMSIPEEVARDIELAEEELSSAKILLQNSKLRDAISRACYSMFHAAKALLLIPQTFRHDQDVWPPFCG